MPANAFIGKPKPTSLESFQQPRRTTYDGRCLAILKSTRAAGAIKLTTRSEGLMENSIAITTGLFSANHGNKE